MPQGHAGDSMELPKHAVYTSTQLSGVEHAGVRY